MKKINNQAELQKMIEKYLKGKANPEEKVFLEAYFEHFDKEENRLSTFSPEQRLALEKEMEFAIENQIERQENRKSWRLPAWVKVAAMVVAIVSIGLYFYSQRTVDRPAIALVDITPKTDIYPGGNKAVLTLANGREISLDDAKIGSLTRESGVLISKTKDGQLIYDLSGMDASGEVALNSIRTPNGGTYQVILPDGTKTWLNAASKLTFPTVFKGNQRKVELIGEAYFEVAKNKQKPFLVSSGNQVVQVLGTHFNVSAYPDDNLIKTTLLEGSVKVSREGTNQSRLLIPGQQAVIGNSGQIELASVNASAAVDWKNGNFVFAKENLSGIMKKIARWYDAEIEFQGKLTEERFVGDISRSVKLSELLAVLQSTDLVHFKIIPGDSNGKGRRVIVMP